MRRLSGKKKILKLQKVSQFQAIDDPGVGLGGQHCSDSHTSSEIWIPCGVARKGIAVLSEDAATLRRVVRTGYVLDTEMTPSRRRSRFPTVETGGGLPKSQVHHRSPDAQVMGSLGEITHSCLQPRWYIGNKVTSLSFLNSLKQPRVQNQSQSTKRIEEIVKATQF